LTQQVTTTGTKSQRDAPEYVRPRLHPVIRTIGDAFRGALIGFAEIVPGVSGGTIALLAGAASGSAGTSDS